MSRTPNDRTQGGPARDFSAGSLSTRELLRAFAAILRELRARDIVRTYNNPIGDIAEEIVARHYGGERGSFSQSSWDVLLPSGERLQVKALRLTALGTRRNLSPIRSTGYDAVVIVVFDEEFRVVEGLRIAREVVEELFPHRPHVNGRVITVTQKLREHPDVETLDLSDALLD
jgi:hypothetical protein